MKMAGVNKQGMLSKNIEANVRLYYTIPNIVGKNHAVIYAAWIVDSLLLATVIIIWLLVAVGWQTEDTDLYTDDYNNNNTNGVNSNHR